MSLVGGSLFMANILLNKNTDSHKKFGYWSIVLLTINSIIGSGIFLSPSEVVKIAGSVTPIIYVIAALFATVLAITFASAAKYVNKNGAAYAYSKAAFGGDFGLYVGLTRFTAGAIAWGVMATAVIKTLLSILNIERSFTNISIGFVLLMISLLGIVLSGSFITKICSNISTIGKIIALLVLIIGGFIIFLISNENHMNEVNGVINPNTNKPYVQELSVQSVVMAVVTAFYAFTGFESVPSAASEMENPEKNLPIAIPLALTFITLIYLGVITISLVINPLDIMTTDQPIALALAFKNPILQSLIVYGALISMIGINIAAAFSTPRIFEAMSEEGQIPKFICNKNSRGIAVPAFLITAVMAIFVPAALSYDMKGIMVISAISRFIQFLVVPIAVIYFYKNISKERILDAKRNFVTDCIIPIIAFILSAFLIIKFDWVKQFTNNGELNLYAIVAMFIGFVLIPLVFYIPYKLGVYKK